MIKEGITGFNRPDLEGLKHKLKALKTDIYSLRRYKINEILDQSHSSNYIRIKLHDIVENNNLDILINGQYGFSCCVSNESSWMNLKFIEVPSALEKKLKVNFPSLNPEYLNLKVNKIDLSKLSKIEIKQVNYWKSETNGEIIFNGYD